MNMLKAGCPVLAVAVFLLLTATANAAPATTIPADDPNEAVFTSAVNAVSSDILPGRTMYLFTGAGSTTAERRAELGNLPSGTILVAVDSTADRLLSMIPGVGGGGVYLPNSKDLEGKIQIAWFTWQDGGYYATGLQLLELPVEADALAGKLSSILQLVCDDPERHNASKESLETSEVAHSSEAKLIAANAPYWRDIGTFYPPDTGSGWWYAHPYGLIGRGLDVDELWYDGSDTVDYWRAHGLDQVVPGIYYYGNDWRSEQYRVKWVANYSYEDMLQDAPPSTEDIWSVTFGVPGSFTVGGQVQDMTIEDISSLYGSPNYVWWRYNWTNHNANIAQLPYSNFNYWWRQQQTQNYAFDCTGYNTYKVVDPSWLGDDHMEVVGGGWGVHANKPGY